METKGRTCKQRKTDERRLKEGLVDYSKYHFSAVEFLIETGKGFLLFLVIGYLFYGSAISVIFLSPCIFVYMEIQRKKKRKKRMEKLKEEFKEMLVLVGECLEAGYSIENSFIESYSFMRERFGEKSDMVQELNIIRQGLKVNVRIEELLTDLAKRSGVEDIKDFAVVFSQAKRGGGNMTSIMKRSIQIIREKIEIKKEIQILLSGKKYEQKIMSMVPMAVIAYISTTSKGFFSILYGNLPGILIMSVCLVAYAGTVLFADYITQIEV